jgi:hypothetical protein
MSPYSVRYEPFLQQLDKANLTATELADLQQYLNCPQPNPFLRLAYAPSSRRIDMDRNAFSPRDSGRPFSTSNNLARGGREYKSFTGAAAHRNHWTSKDACSLKARALNGKRRKLHRLDGLGS